MSVIYECLSPLLLVVLSHVVKAEFVPLWSVRKIQVSDLGGQSCSWQVSFSLSWLKSLENPLRLPGPWQDEVREEIPITDDCSV